MIKDFKNVLVFAAHHDDETLGCGATISKLSDLFSNITVVFFTNGDTGIDQTKKYEKNKDFIQRCMGNAKMGEENPDRDQRYAVCQTIWKDQFNPKK